jgi:hydroxyacylglutathione hydrolase
MSIIIQTVTLGPLANNTIILTDRETHQAVVIDPSYGAEEIQAVLAEEGIKVKEIWLTHAHFDHIAGAAGLAASTIPNLAVHLHADDLPLWQQGGAGAELGFHVELAETVLSDLVHGQILRIGDNEIEVRFTPGHTRGHVIFYIPSAGTAVVGDLIFHEGVGRTDLPGGNARTLLKSIREQVFTLPPETILIPGHGPSTTVAHEQVHNPFLA